MKRRTHDIVKRYDRERRVIVLLTIIYIATVIALGVASLMNEN